MTTLVIEVDCDDDSDFDWLRDRCVASVEEVVVQAKEEGRLDGAVDVSWDIADS